MGLFERFLTVWVALAILAEMQAVLGARDGRPLRERHGPIHG